MRRVGDKKFLDNPGRAQRFSFRAPYRISLSLNPDSVKAGIRLADQVQPGAVFEVGFGNLGGSSAVEALLDAE